MRTPSLRAQAPGNDHCKQHRNDSNSRHNMAYRSRPPPVMPRRKLSVHIQKPGIRYCCQKEAVHQIPGIQHRKPMYIKLQCMIRHITAHHADNQKRKKPENPVSLRPFLPLPVIHSDGKEHHYRKQVDFKLFKLFHHASSLPKILLLYHYCFCLSVKKQGKSTTILSPCSQLSFYSLRITDIFCETAPASSHTLF